MTADPTLKLDNQLCFALYAASNAMTRLYRDKLEPLGLTYPQYLVLLVLWDQDGVAVKEIGQRLHLDSGTLTPMLKRMEQSGLIQRRRSSADERQVDIFLTPAGQALKAEVRGVRAELGCLLPMPAADIARLQVEIRSLADGLIAAKDESSTAKAG
ncbi:MarR family winged helix-turn-helix transcriptional regulator [Ferrovibrio sp.]|uniref:MarR family winged helix-turn-helix transcriptional regulator n=1 Tax=Ferrovibrio sp. TaxID=1917215 RepID=UPI000CB2DEEF|nr:MarR family transcriptional regulator [Ferrovibrio sp.]PJI40192.1 MAG: MarR family transcriptional regulator [Ferrovibrio sp.]